MNILDMALIAVFTLLYFFTFFCDLVTFMCDYCNNIIRGLGWGRVVTVGVCVCWGGGQEGGNGLGWGRVVTVFSRRVAMDQS